GLVALLAAFRVGRMGVAAPLSAVVGASGPVLFGLGAGERPPAPAFAGVGLAVLAIALVSASADVGRFSLRGPGVALALLSGLLSGGYFVSLAQSRGNAGIGLLLT